jgi:hypothetical protein
MTALAMLGRVEMPAFWMPTTKGEEPAPFHGIKKYRINSLTAVRQRRGLRRANRADSQHGEAIEED